MRCIFTILISTVVLTSLMGTGAYAAPAISFLGPPPEQGPTPADGATIAESSVEIQAAVTEQTAPVTQVTFNWDGTDYTLYDSLLVLMFNFDNVSALGESSTYFADLSLYSNNGAGQNFEADELVSGKYQNAVNFDGIDDYILVGDSAELNITEFTIAFWFRANKPTGGTQSLVARGEDWINDKAQWVVELDDAQNPDTVQLWFEQSDDSDHYYGLNTSISQDTWYHFAATRSVNGTVKVYLNGKKQNEWTNQPAPAVVSTPVTIGARRNQPEGTIQDYFQGTIDELRICNIALSEDEVAELFMSNLYKYDLGQWVLYVNQSNLANGTYTYQASASDGAGTSWTEQRTLTVDAPPEPVQILEGPYLQQVSQDAIVIMWQTDVAAESRVDYWTSETDTYFAEDPTPVTVHEVNLTGLSADRPYYYTVTSGATTSPTSAFATAPASPRSFRFAAYGDTRSQPTEHAAVVQAIINTAPELVLHTGDLVETGRDYASWETEFFNPAHDLMNNTPLLPILGNHEYNGTGPLWFLDLFSLGNNDQWFAFTYGNVRFIGLNTNEDYSTGSEQYDWLVAELQSAEYANATWHIVYFHHPPYTAASNHSDDPTVQQYLLPLFEQHGVNMVFSGHTHAYERYFHNGIYYIVTGGGGAPLGTLLDDTQEPIRQFGISAYHHCVIDVNVPDVSLTLQARYNDGTAFDTITITRKATNPDPSDGTTQVAVDADLSWTAGINAVSHDVYFGTDQYNLPLVSGQQTETVYDPGILQPETTYYWAVDEHDSSGAIIYGDVWSFTTGIINQSPVAADDLYSVDEDNQLIVPAPGVLANDTDPENDPLTAELVSDISNGTLTLNSDGSFAYTPNPNFYGTDTFTYVANDGTANSNIATATITVNPLNDPPVANAGPDRTVTDSDNNGSETVTLDGSFSSDIDGSITNYQWKEGQTTLGTGAIISVDLNVGTHTITLTVTDNEAATDSDELLITVRAASAPVDDTTNGEISVKGTSTGDYIATQTPDDLYEAITEEQSGGGQPKNLRSSLEHIWTINVTGGDNVTFYLQAYHTANAEGDDFVFAYSIDNLNYTDMLTVTKTTDDNIYQTCSLPGSISGTVYIRVQDTDQSKGHGTTDTIYVDHMFIRSSIIVAAPEKAGNPSPADGAIDVFVDADLSWTAGVGADSHDIYFGTDPAHLPLVSQGQTAATYDPGTLNYNTTYCWRIDEKNSYGVTTGDVWSFTTGSSGTGEIYVYDITMNSGKAGKNYYALATVWIKDDTGLDVEGATVYGQWSGLVSGASTGVTGSDGKLTLRSPNTKASGTITFTITNVQASGYTYNPDMGETSDYINVP